jgi:hypothetical protein
VKKSTKGVSARVRVRTTHGRLSVKGKVQQTTEESQCAYPSQAPSVSSAPTAPTLDPTHAPTELPSGSPSPLPSSSPTRQPSSLPTSVRTNMKPCDSISNAYTNDVSVCQVWMNPETWTGSSLPSFGDFVQAQAPPWPLNASSTFDVPCVKLEGDDAIVSRLSVKTAVDDRRMRVKVSHRGKLTVKGTAAMGNFKNCFYPSPSPTVSNRNAFALAFARATFRAYAFSFTCAGGSRRHHHECTDAVK